MIPYKFLTCSYCYGTPFLLYLSPSTFLRRFPQLFSQYQIISILLFPSLWIPKSPSLVMAPLSISLVSAVAPECVLTCEDLKQVRKKHATFAFLGYFTQYDLF